MYPTFTEKETNGLGVVIDPGEVYTMKLNIPLLKLINIPLLKLLNPLKNFTFFFTFSIDLLPENV